MSEINQAFLCRSTTGGEARLVEIMKVVHDVAPFNYLVRDVLTDKTFVIKENRIMWGQAYNEMEVLAWASKNEEG